MNNVIKNQLEKEKISEITYELIRERVASMNIYFDQLVYSKITESPKTEFFDLIANMG